MMTMHSSEIPWDTPWCGIGNAGRNTVRDSIASRIGDRRRDAMQLKATPALRHQGRTNAEQQSQYANGTSAHSYILDAL